MRRRQHVVPVDEGSAAGVVYPAVDEVAQEDDEGELAQLGPLSPEHVVAVVVGAALAQLGVGAPSAKGLRTEGSCWCRCCCILTYTYESRKKKFSKYRSVSISERDLSHPVAVVLDSLRLGRENSSGGVGRRRRRRGAGGAAVEEALVVGAALVLIQIIKKKSHVFCGNGMFLSKNLLHISPCK